MQTVYTVKAGDSLSRIARDVLGDLNRWPEIAQLNNIASPYVIEIGQQLQLPESRTVMRTDIIDPGFVVREPVREFKTGTVIKANATPVYKNPLFILGGVLIIGYLWQRYV